MFIIAPVKILTIGPKNDLQLKLSEFPLIMATFFLIKFHVFKRSKLGSVNSESL